MDICFTSRLLTFFLIGPGQVNVMTERKQKLTKIYTKRANTVGGIVYIGRAKERLDINVSLPA